MGRFDRFRPVAAALIVAATAACHEAAAPKAPQATLRISLSGEKTFAMTRGSSFQLPITLITTGGTPLGAPTTFTLVSRDPVSVSVDSGSWINARAATVGVWIVGTAPYDGQILTDSVQVIVVCTLELIVILNPPSLTLAVGESATPTVTLKGCGGLTLADTFTWSAMDSTIVSVDASTGRTTGLRVGQTGVRPQGARYGSIGVIPVTVR